MLLIPILSTNHMFMLGVEDADRIFQAGKFVAAALKNPSETLGAQILAAADYYTPTRILAEFEEVAGKKARFVQVDSETYKSFMPGWDG